MAILPILRWPDPRLNRPCETVGEVTAEVRALAADMLETMYAAPGRGLAAPQVGVLRRIFVMDVGWKDGAPAPVVMIDPVVLGTSDATLAIEEGCLSIPGAPAEVVRPAEITMRWTTPEGEIMARRLTGGEARCAQHELDHLDGLLILDRIGADARAALAPALDLLRRQA
jgi:peptide deformylase